jgi:hypothetical protein
VGGDDAGVWQFGKSLPLCDLSDAVPDAGYHQGDDDKAAENDEAETTQSHRYASTMNKPRSMTTPSCLQGPR